jgi:hypothetical protein
MHVPPQTDVGDTTGSTMYDPGGMEPAIEHCAAFSAAVETSVKRAALEKRGRIGVLGELPNTSHEVDQLLRAHVTMVLHRVLGTMSCSRLQFMVVRFWT